MPFNRHSERVAAPESGANATPCSYRYNHRTRSSYGNAALVVSAVTLLAALPIVGGAQPRASSGSAQERLIREVRHKLVMLPYYGVFDNLAYRVNGNTVELYGQVTRPTLKSDAEGVVKKIEGVDRVVNNIEVLPLSPNDDRLRLALFRAIYGHTALNRYAIQAVPPIHIIVTNGNVTLEGVVATQMDKQIAEMQAKSVPGVFSVTNNLKVESSEGGTGTSADRKDKK
jgi:hyperosmotically inducible periplasmic protein